VEAVELRENQLAVAVVLGACVLRLRVNTPIDHNALGEGGGQAIAAALRVNTTLTNLHFCYNSLGEGGRQAIAAALRVNTTLTELNLHDHSLGEGGAQAIAALRLKMTLTWLNLWNSSLGEGGAQAIDAALRVNNTLTNLNIGANCNWAEEGRAQAIAAALRVNMTLTELSLGYNQLGDGAESAVRQSWGNRGGTLWLD
jgi:Ran GTPase-activating protein (RanGAP) involved in mRNA processing and transport